MLLGNTGIFRDGFRTKRSVINEVCRDSKQQERRVNGKDKAKTRQLSGKHGINETCEKHGTRVITEGEEKLCLAGAEPPFREKVRTRFCPHRAAAEEPCEENIPSVC